MQRYFVSESEWTDYGAVISGDDYHHITRVMRFQAGDRIIICLSGKASFEGEIEAIEQDRVIVRSIKPLNEQSELPIKITIAQGLPKGDKLETIAQKGTELGMDSLVPIHMDRSITRWDEKKSRKKQQRLQKISKEASEQSHRFKIPDIYPVANLKDVVKQHAFDHLLVASEYTVSDSEHPSTFKQVIDRIKENQNVLVVIGPEGGLSNEELQYLQSLGAKEIRLGRRILRTETASLYVLSAFSFYFEEWS